MIEGDGTLLMSLWAQEHLSFMELLELVGMAVGPNQEGLEDAPPFVRESLLFPYEAGLNFAMGLQLEGGWEAVNRVVRVTARLHRADPAPGEVHRARGAGGGGAARRPRGDGWARAGRRRSTTRSASSRSVPGSARSGAESVAAAAAGAGWGGDRIALLEGPDDAWAIAWETAWDTPADAEQFAAAVPPAANADVTRHDNDRVTLVLGSDDATRTKLAAALD